MNTGTTDKSSNTQSAHDVAPPNDESRFNDGNLSREGCVEPSISTAATSSSHLQAGIEARSNGGLFMLLPIEVRREVYALLGLSVTTKDLRFKVVNEKNTMPKVNDHYIFASHKGELAIMQEEWEEVSPTTALVFMDLAADRTILESSCVRQTGSKIQYATPSIFSPIQASTIHAHHQLDGNVQSHAR